MKTHPFLPTALLSLGFAGASQADILFSNLLQGEDGLTGFNTLNIRLATDFLTDGTTWSITSLSARLDNSSVVETLTVSFSIYTDSGGSPDALLSAFDLPVSVLPGGATGTYTTTSSGINLQANTIYWVVGQVLNESIGGTATWKLDSGEGTDVGPFATVATTPRQQSLDGGGLYTALGDGNYLYALEGSPIPEASALPVVVIAGTFGAFGWWHRRRVAGGSVPDHGLAS